MFVAQYRVGEDLTQERYNEILAALTEWFREYRPSTDAADAARYTLECCLAGVQLKDGKTPWTKMAKSTLENRIKAASRYDIVAMQPIRQSEKARPKEARQKSAAKVSSRAKDVKRILTEDTTYSAASLKKAPETLDYGDNPLALFNPTELVRRDKLREAFLADFPQLSSVAAQSKLDMLLDLTLLMDRLRLRQLREQSVSAIEDQMAEVTKQILALEKALNIHPDQVAKQQREKEGGTVGEAARKLEESVPEEIRERWFAEELLMMYQMFHQRSPRTNMGGHQLDEVGLFGLTRCRTCSCSGCGQKNFAGLDINEIETWLMENGHIVPHAVSKPVELRRRTAVGEVTTDDGSTAVDEAVEGDYEDASDDRAED